jgi:hypothetical protein
MRSENMQAAKLEPEISEQTPDLTKEQLEEMAVAFSSAIAKMDQKIEKDTKERSEFKKKLRAVEAKLVTINTRNRLSGEH